MIEELFKKKQGVMKLGLDRMERAKQIVFGENSRAFEQTILVGGTNGKGATAGMLWHLCCNHGIKAGLYSSPHLVDFSERFQIAGELISLMDIEKELLWLKERLGRLFDELSFFELSTLTAVSLFRRHGVELTILEVGLGGRLDATNVFDPIASVIVSLGLDHQDRLGSTLSEILTEKLGICRRGRPLFYGDEISGRLEAQLDEYASELEFPVYRFGHDYRVTETSWTAQIGCGLKFRASLPQWVAQRPQVMFRRNFATSAAVFSWFIKKRAMQAEALSRRKHQSIQNLVEKAFAKVATPATLLPKPLFGRFSELAPIHLSSGKARRMIIDVSHNVPAIQSFVDSLRHHFGLDNGSFLPGIISILADKDMNGMLDLLREVLNPVILYKSNDERAFKREQIAERHKDLLIYEDFAQLWEAINIQWSDEVSPWVVVGSVASAGKILSFFEMPVPNYFDEIPRLCTRSSLSTDLSR